MKITCQTCQSKYTVSDEKVQGKTVKIKCRKCGATILVNSSGATTSAAGGADSVSISTSASELGVSFLVNVAEGDQRSMSLVEVVEAYNISVITAETYVWSDGMGDWQPLGQVESIVAALNNSAAPAHAESLEPAAYAAPAAAPYEAAAAPQPAAEPVHRPAARRESGRRGPDLFGGGMGTEEVATSAPAFNGRAPAPMAASGQREENSMLFSLSALTAKAAPSSPTASSSSSKTSGTREDSGLIDLKALADGAGASGPTNYVPDHAGLFPLGAPQAAAPVVAPLAAMSVPPPPASKAPIFIGVGIAVAAFAIIGAFFVMKGGTPPVVVTENTAQAAPSAVPPPVEPPPTVAVAATPAPSASAAVAAAGKTTKGGGGPVKAGTGAVPVKTGTGPTPPTPPVVPKKSACGCAAGDLMCAMKCSAK